MARPKLNPLSNIKEAKPLIQPLIRAEGEKHVLEEIFEGDPAQMPTLKSIGYACIPGTTSWVSYVIETKGREVISITVDEPNHRSIAEESSKINFVNALMVQGL